jgi:hypothetical protein
MLLKRRRVSFRETGTKMGCFKLLGKQIITRDFDRQVAEMQVRAAILNGFTQLPPHTTMAMP